MLLEYPEALVDAMLYNDMMQWHAMAWNIFVSFCCAMLRLEGETLVIPTIFLNSYDTLYTTRTDKDVLGVFFGWPMEIDK